MNGSDFKIQVLLRSEQTDDQLGVVRNTAAASWPGPPLHHHDFDETFYVLDGELTFQLEDELIPVSAGNLAFARRGVRHTFANLSDAPATYLLVVTPGNFERNFDGLAAQFAGAEPPPEAAKPYQETVVVGPTIPERLAAS